jgi:pimeloyl-ACP methyl ester carboxylesterase
MVTHERARAGDAEHRAHPAAGFAWERAERFDAGGGVALSARFHGDPSGPATLLLHGGGANASWWAATAPALARDRWLVALDFRGHGDSDHPEQRMVGAFHRDVEALVAHLDARREPRRYALVGHSMGAHVALDHAARNPRVAAVVAIEPSRGAPKTDRRRARLALAARRSYRTREEAIARYRFLPAADLADEALRVYIAERSIRREPDGRYGFKFDPRWFHLPPATPQPRSDITCPVLIVRGAESGLLTAEGARELVDELPDARLLDVPGAGHNVHLERPEAVARAIAEHLDLGEGAS